MIRGNIHPQPSGRNSLGEEIKNSHPEPGPLMAGIVHVNMGHCPYYHITFRRAPRPYTRPGIAYKYQQLQNRGWFVPLPSLSVSPVLDGNSIIYGRQSTFPLCNRINATVYRDIFYFSLSLSLSSCFRTTKKSTSRRGRRERNERGRDDDIRQQPRVAVSLRDLENLIRLDGKSRWLVQFSRNCRLTNILERKLRKLARRARSNEIIASIFTRPRGRGEQGSDGR